MSPASAQGGQGAASHGGGKRVKTVKHYLKDNTKLCADDQKGQCKNPMHKCPKGKHMCGAVEVGGRVCGGRRAPAKCNNKKVERV